MTRLLRRLLAIVAFVGVFAYLLTGAVDQEFASAEEGRVAAVMTGARAGVRSNSLLLVSESTYQGKAASIRAIRKVFGPRAPAAIRVASCETGGTFYARAVSRTGDYGLFQANYQAHHWRGESHAAFARRHFNLAYHVPWAYKLSRGGTNWRAWACRWAA